MAIKNQSVVVEYIAWDTSANDYKTGDVANHTIYNTLDGTASAANNSPAEVDATNRPGLYRITLDAGETNGNSYGWGGKSATANVVLFGFFALTERGGVASLGTQVGSVGTLTTSVGVAVASSETIITTAVSSSETIITTATSSLGTLTTSVGTSADSTGTDVTTVISDIAGLENISPAQVLSECTDALSGYGAATGTNVASVGALTTSVGVAVASSETIIITAVASSETIITTATSSIGTLTTSVGAAVASSETVIKNTPMDLDPDGTTSGKVAAAIAGQADASASGSDRTFSFKEVGDNLTEKLNVTVDEDGNRTIN